jgi:phage gp46-like protein
MADIELNWQAAELGADVRLSGTDLSVDNELRSAVVLSLFSWRRANDDDALPDEASSRLGWWGDSYATAPNNKLGSRLWLLRREKLTQDTISRAIEYCREALQWLIEDRVASRVDVEADRNGIDRLDISITITRADGQSLNLRFANAWRTIQQGVLNG